MSSTARKGGASSPTPDHARKHREREAAHIITRYARKHMQRKHGGKSMLSLWPSVDRLRFEQLDERALKAGAADCEWYTDEMLVAREKLKHDRVVVTALQKAWELIRPPADVLTHEEYILMSRKIYLALKADAEEGAPKWKPIGMSCLLVSTTQRKTLNPPVFDGRRL